MRRMMSSNEFCELFGAMLGFPDNCSKITITIEAGKAVTMEAIVVNLIEVDGLKQIQEEMIKWELARKDSE